MSFGLPIDPGTATRHLISRAFHKNRHGPIITLHAGECQEHNEANLRRRRWMTRNRPGPFTLSRLPANIEAHTLVVVVVVFPSSRPNRLFPAGCRFVFCLLFFSSLFFFFFRIAVCTALQFTVDLRREKKLLASSYFSPPLHLYMLPQPHCDTSKLPPTARFICLKHLQTESHLIWTS